MGENDTIFTNFSKESKKAEPYRRKLTITIYDDMNRLPYSSDYTYESNICEQDKEAVHRAMHLRLEAILNKIVR